MFYEILANMAGSAGHFFHPSGMGGYWSYLGWWIFEMTIIHGWKDIWHYVRKDTFRVLCSEGHFSLCSEGHFHDIMFRRTHSHNVFFWKEKYFLWPNVSPISFINSVRSKGSHRYPWLSYSFKTGGLVSVGTFKCPQTNTGLYNIDRKMF